MHGLILHVKMRNVCSGGAVNEVNFNLMLSIFSVA